MKSIRTLRLLSLVGFLLLIAPFYDQCNGHGMKKAVAAAEEVMIDTTAVETSSVKNSDSTLENNILKDTIVSIKKNEVSFYQKAYEFLDDDNNENAFELAIMARGFFEASFAEFKKELSEDFKKHRYDGLSLFIRSISFVFVVLMSFTILILSLLIRVKWVYKLSIVNLFLIVITLICILFFDSLFETYKQIKWGYYAFTLVQIGICYTSKFQISLLREASRVRA